jgi:hypothetical protein
MSTAISDFRNRTTKSFTVTVTYEGVSDFTGDSLRLILKYSNESPTINKLVSLSSGGVGTFLLTTTDTNIEAKTYLVYVQWERATGEKYEIPLDSDVVTVKENPVPVA